jgi:hypothetical protein
MDTDNFHKRALELWQEHTSAQRLETDFATQNLLGKAYAAHHVVRTSPKLSDLLAFAKAGHAAAEPVLEGGQDAARVYRAPTSRVEGQTGKVENSTSFGRWDYVWEGAKFILYEMAYIDRFATAQRVLYVLYPNIDPPRHRDSRLQRCSSTSSFFVPVSGPRKPISRYGCSITLGGRKIRPFGNPFERRRGKM